MWVWLCGGSMPPRTGARRASDLHELHRIVHEQVAVIPLWQTVNYLVYSRRLDGVGPAPLTLYQNVEQWQLATPAMPVMRHRCEPIRCPKMNSPGFAIWTSRTRGP